MAVLDLNARIMRKPITELLVDEFIQLPQVVGIGRISRTSLAPGSVLSEVCHLHPGCLGTFKETFQYAIKLRSSGVPLQIHKDYLIGPACSAWQLAAGALDAEWKELSIYHEPGRLCPSMNKSTGIGFYLDMSYLSIL